jgi:hypothetical protein
MKTVEEINAEIKELKESGQSVKGISDTHHSFEECYDDRNEYFMALCHAYPELSWKSRKHFDEVKDSISNFKGCFITGITTPKGTITRHIKLEHWDEFEVKEIPNAPEYDGYTRKVEKERVRSLRLVRRIGD